MSVPGVTVIRMAAKPRPIPDRNTLDALSRAALVNARRQVTRAERLLADGDWPGAHALATLAFEEVGKALICMISMGTPQQFLVNGWFHEAFKTHTSKITVARFALAMFTALDNTEGSPSQPVVQAIEQMSMLADADHQMKMRGLYVDLRDGNVLQPVDVGEHDARFMIANVGACLEILTLFMTDSDAAADFKAFMAHLAIVMDALIDSPDADGLAFLQQMWDAVNAPGPPIPPWEIFPGMVPAPPTPDD